MSPKSGIPPIPPQQIKKLLADSEPTIARYAAGIYLDSKWVSSGTYARCCGYEGILTAGHCANDFLAGDTLA
jgi:hypothetical protein